mmetsp:Transcript_11966/g.32358  ORF Transcript_11966/g.32358 Transcript_11966/m.32358 type:complete len:318 (-) Transcript_11966:56-1009(-)
MVLSDGPNSMYKRSVKPTLGFCSSLNDGEFCRSPLDTPCSTTSCTPPSRSPSMTTNRHDPSITTKPVKMSRCGSTNCWSLSVYVSSAAVLGSTPRVWAFLCLTTCNKRWMSEVSPSWNVTTTRPNLSNRRCIPLPNALGASMSPFSNCCSSLSASSRDLRHGPTMNSLPSGRCNFARKACAVPRCPSSPGGDLAIHMLLSSSCSSSAAHRSSSSASSRACIFGATGIGTANSARNVHTVPSLWYSVVRSSLSSAVLSASRLRPSSLSNPFVASGAFSISARRIFLLPRLGTTSARNDKKSARDSKSGAKSKCARPWG